MGFVEDEARYARSQEEREDVGHQAEIDTRRKSRSSPERSFDCIDRFRRV